MPDLPDPIQDILAKFGFTDESMKRFRFGGIIGKVTMVAIAGLGASVLAVRAVTGTALQITALIVPVVAALVVIRWILNYGHAHPLSATLEGGEALLWQQQQIMAAAKNMTPPSESQRVIEPGGQISQIPDSKEPETE